VFTPDIGSPQGHLDPAFNFDKFSGAPRIRFAPIRNSAQRMHDSGVIPPAKAPANLWQAAIGPLPHQRHGDLARPSQAPRTAGPNHFASAQMVITAHDTKNDRHRVRCKSVPDGLAWINWHQAQPSNR
jgi:hypothetical protein